MATGLSTYNYFMASYVSSVKSNRYDTHKKSELKNIYNSIVKMNKDNPIYMFKKSQEASALAVDIKESARELTNTLASIGTDQSSQDSMFNRKIAFSSNPDVLDVTYIGEDGSEEDTTFQIEVRELAKPQINIGNALYPNSEVFLAAGDYSFDVAINDLNYELQLSVNPGDNNQSLFDRVARLFNKSISGIDAAVRTNDSGQIYMELTSSATGESSYGDLFFGMGPNESKGSSDILDYLGINKVSQMPANSSFLLNGQERSSFANTFTVNKNFEINLKNISQDGASTIAFKTNTDSLADNITRLATAFNKVLDSASNEKGYVSKKLLSEIGGISKNYKNELEAIGINVDNKGHLGIDRGLLLTNLEDSEGKTEITDLLSNFENAVSRGAKRIMLNPMDYTDKTLVAYKNPNVNHYNAPYFTSAYSGMMFNSYC